ncbi:MAG: 3-isopropylmalate dehydratase small subunit [Deltaproteobacteria bacterium]
MKIRDRVFEVYSDNISTDRIVPTRLVTEVTPEKLAPIAMKDVDEKFHEKLDKGKIMVAGRNFGYASSREYAPLALKAAGVKAVIARSFARIFFRNSINIGLPILECEEADRIKVHDEVEIDLKTGEITDLTRQFTLRFAPLPDFLLEWMTEGGMVNYLEKNK